MSPEPSVYLHDIPLVEAWDRLVRALRAEGLWGILDSEAVPIAGALGRVTAEAVWARTSSPHYHGSAMDGYAVTAASTAQASERRPIDLRLGDQAVYVDTGDALPDWTDSVIPIEDVEPVEPGQDRRSHIAVRIRKPVSPWSHVRPIGEDLVATELVLPGGHILRPVDLGALAACGITEVRVARRPSVVIIPTGSELVPAGSPASPGQIPEFNSIVLAAQVDAWGGSPKRLDIIPDDFERIRAVVAGAAAGSDLILLNAGSSAGSEDFSARIIGSLGEVLAHGVAVRPGHPVVIGMIRRTSAAAPWQGRGRTARVPILGVPGFPVSAALTGEILVEPLLARWTGRPAHEPPTLEGTLTRKVHSSAGDLEYLRVTVGRVGEKIVVAPLARGAGVLTSLVRADGIVRIPPGVQGLEAGECVTVHLYRSPSEVDRTIVALGSHDLTLDLMAQFLAEEGLRLTSANLGSLGGLIALGRGEAHLAGSHLLDPVSGEFNLRYIDEYLPDRAIVVVALVGREQGLIHPPGNPKGLKDLQDLARPEIRFVNRQRGSGTRLLLDYHLERLGVNPSSVHGYEHEEYSHLTVAAAVASGRADCALGIRAAADALKLGFTPLFQERYDLIIPREHYESPKLAPVLRLLESTQFRKAVSGLPGYDVAPMGKVIATRPG
jgi:putative molybdopterin biosynthesis protein